MLTTPELPWLDEQVRGQRAIVDDVLGQREWGWFWPHLSLAYFHGAEDPEATADAIRLHVDAVGATLTVDPTLTLMRLHRDRRVYEWDVLQKA